MKSDSRQGEAAVGVMGASSVLSIEEGKGG